MVYKWIQVYIPCEHFCIFFLQQMSHQVKCDSENSFGIEELVQIGSRCREVCSMAILPTFKYAFKVVFGEVILEDCKQLVLVEVS